MSNSNDKPRHWRRIVIVPQGDGTYATLSHGTKPMQDASTPIDRMTLWQGQGMIREHGTMTAAEILTALIECPDPVRFVIRHPDHPERILLQMEP